MTTSVVLGATVAMVEVVVTIAGNVAALDESSLPHPAAPNGASNPTPTMRPTGLTFTLRSVFGLGTATTTDVPSLA
jgi:hypothetical protein